VKSGAKRADGSVGMNLFLHPLLLWDFQCLDDFVGDWKERVERRSNGQRENGEKK